MKKLPGSSRRYSLRKLAHCGSNGIHTSPKTTVGTWVISSLLAFCFCCIPSARAQSYILGKADFPGGVNISSLAAADFNGDGRQDLVSANESANTVSIMLGKPDATFLAPVAFPAGTSPKGVAAADLNADGKQDVAVASNNDRTISVLLGNGDGSLQGAATYPGPSGFSHPWAVLVFDANNDNKPDLLVGCYSTNLIAVYIGNGDGTFQMPLESAADFYPTSVAIADFNGDGKIDLATSNVNNSTYSILLGLGDGTFNNALTYSAGFSFPLGTQTIAAGNFDPDGKADLVLLDLGGQTMVFLAGQGDGSFAAPVSYSAGFNPHSLINGDFNGDGKLDIAVVEMGDGTLSIFLGKGDGTFNPRVTCGIGVDANAITRGDLNGDGVVDLAVSFRTNTPVPGNTFSVVLGMGDGRFQSREDYEVGGFSRSVQAGDFNGDGSVDLVTANQGISTSPSVSVLLGIGDGSFQSQTEFPAGSRPFSVATGNFNGDDHLDLAVTDFDDSSVYILLGNGDGTLQAPLMLATEPFPVSVSVANLDGDSFLDLAVAAWGNKVSVLRGKGDGTFFARVNYTTGSGKNVVIARDVTGDGKVDLVVTAQEGEFVSVFPGAGDGTFPTRADFPLIGRPVGVASADLDQDGKIDLALAVETSTQGGVVSILRGSGGGNFLPAIDYPATNFINGVQTGDITGDGKVDIIALTSDQLGGFYVLKGNGDGTVQFPVYFATNLFPDSAAIVDLNNDGAMDIASASQGALVSVLLNIPNIVLFPAPLAFGNQKVGSLSAQKTVKVFNPGSMPLEIAGVATGAVFPSSTGCPLKPGQLSVGGNCDVNVEFLPDSSGPQSGLLLVTDNAGTGIQAVELSGAGTVPMASLSTSSVDFGKQALSTDSASQQVVLSNIGEAALDISGLTLDSDFLETNDCGAQLPGSHSCTLTLRFKPTATGTRTGSLTITHDAPNSPLVVALSGIGTDFSLNISSNSSTSATVKAGQTATYSLTLAPVDGFDQAVSFTCSGAPLRSACSVSPTSVLFDGVNEKTVSVSVVTTAPTTTAAWGTMGDISKLVHQGLDRAYRHWVLILLAVLSTIIGICGSFRSFVPARRRFSNAILVFALAFLSMVLSCGGGGGGGGLPGTPTGSYTLTIQANFSSGGSLLTRQLPLTLVVN